jgi:hypothetical protein
MLYGSSVTTLQLTGISSLSDRLVATDIAPVFVTEYSKLLAWNLLSSANTGLLPQKSANPFGEI